MYLILLIDRVLEKAQISRDIVEDIGDNCYNPTSKYCFIKCINFLTENDFKQQFLEVIRNQQRRLHVMSQAKIQPFCRAKNINIGFYSGKELFPRKIIEKSKALSLHSNHFCLIWKSEGINFNNAVEELKGKIEIVEKYINIDIINGYIENLYTPKKTYIQN